MNILNKMKLLPKIFIVAFTLFYFMGAGAKSAHALTLTPIRLELKGDPGQTMVQKITLINETQSSQTFYPSFANFEAQGEDGTPTFVDPVDGLGTWMSVPTSSIILDPAQATIIPVTIRIPTNAEPGGYFGAVFWGTVPPVSSTSQNAVAIGAKTGVLVLLSVKGDVQKSATIVNFDTKNSQHFYTALPVEMAYKFQNTGGDRVKPEGTILIKNILGIKAKTLDANPIKGNVLPKQIRRFDVSWQKRDATPLTTSEKESQNFIETVKYQWHNFALGYFSANLALSDIGANGTASAQTKFVVFPWQLLLVILILFFILYLILRMLIKRYNRWIIGQAEVALEQAQELKEKKSRKRILK